MKNIRVFYLKIFIFLVVKFSIYLNRHVFVMLYRCMFTFEIMQNKTFYGKQYSKIDTTKIAHAFNSKFKNVS